MGFAPELTHPMPGIVLEYGRPQNKSRFGVTFGSFSHRSFRNGMLFCFCVEEKRKEHSDSFRSLFAGALFEARVHWLNPFMER